MCRESREECLQFYPLLRHLTIPRSLGYLNFTLDTLVLGKSLSEVDFQRSRNVPRSRELLDPYPEERLLRNWVRLRDGGEIQRAFAHIDSNQLQMIQRITIPKELFGYEFCGKFPFDQFGLLNVREIFYLVEDADSFYCLNTKSRKLCEKWNLHSG